MLSDKCILIPIKITAKLPFYFSHSPNLGTFVCNTKIPRLFVFSGAYDGLCGGSRASSSHPCARGIRLGTIPCFLLQILHCLGWENKSVLMWHAVMSFCCAAGSRGAGTPVSVLQGWWKSAHSKPSHWLQLCFKACWGLCHRNKGKALPCYLPYFHKEWLLLFQGEGATLHSLCLNPTVRFNSSLLCFVWARVPCYFGGICCTFIGCEEFLVSSCCFNWVVWSYKNPQIYFLNILLSIWSGKPHSNCCLPPRKTLLKSL